MRDFDPGQLLAIVAHARAGALDRALQLFDSIGLPAVQDQPSVLNLKGRLLKDGALRSRGPGKQADYLAAAAAYERSASLQPASYPLINAAALSLLGGDSGRANALAARVLRLVEEQPDEPETPYYRAATRAEAFLLLDRHDEARASFAEAVALAPRAWEDHASTLRQFALILSAQGRDASWLDAHRPPRSLHFGGHMSFDPKVVRREHLDEKIAAVLEEENVGFGFGALAAGADIIIAEALVARGAELHAILPGGVEAFAAVSVDPFGKAWRRRFDSVLAMAEAVRPVRPLGATPDAGMIGLADEVAMGAALMNGRRLESSAVQLLVLDSADGADGASGRSRETWAAGGWRQRVLTAPRETRQDASTPADDSAEPLAVLAIGLETDRPLQPALAELHGLVAKLPAPAVAPYLAEDRLILAYAGPGDAAEAAVRLLGAASDTARLRIGGQYGPAVIFRDPFADAVRLDPAATAAAAAALASAPPGTACVTDDFAAALAAAGPHRPASEYIGELDAPDGGPPVGLYALKSYDQLFQPLRSNDGQ
ncbi:MAG TPA: tetratricopeptide repeat-containing protein [Allosphingosinicella sp.]|nr:tetratricopeptide repeat-containing protein [Allosphingosinicella sp.]